MFQNNRSKFHYTICLSNFLRKKCLNLCSLSISTQWWPFYIYSSRMYKDWNDAKNYFMLRRARVHSHVLSVIQGNLLLHITFITEVKNKIVTGLHSYFEKLTDAFVYSSILPRLVSTIERFHWGHGVLQLGRRIAQTDLDIQGSHAHHARTRSSRAWTMNGEVHEDTVTCINEHWFPLL